MTLMLSEGTKMQKMDDDPMPTPKVKASRKDGQVNQVEEMDGHVPQ